ncbi:RNA-binding domain-containing protein [Gallibacterium salpingitidis]|uniref:ATPase AAA n=1 Tax=Gallibacterium salpingitidis TaxID=505341 RepID=A0A1A7NUM3_9PAST|nr:RNA-binding domain-containing protein [Gallibacterium salpingitidis]OBW92719.1 ATPase AAA [Gallibacterium salpingitidis]
MTPLSIKDELDLQTLSESEELEFKSAQGRDGKGKLPDDFWPTYSAMANCRGGYVILGVSEKKGKFKIEGVSNIDLVRKQLFDILNNKNKVNLNLLNNNNLTVHIINDKPILIIQIPPAKRQEKPIYLNNQPMKETFIRLNESDHRCTEEQIKRMMAEQIESSRDDKILKGFSLADIDKDSLQAYKNLFAIAKPNHIWLEKDLLELFKNIGGWRKDRQTGEEGITLAGILMFGTWEAIQEAVPYYFVDYQELEHFQAERWTDRIYPDGSWSGNLFDFYRKTYRKLIADLKVPFKLKNGIRLDQSKTHEAIREALVNTLVHTDYSGRASILIKKLPDKLSFRNPGLMRISPDIAIKGGESDCRNRRLHQMFLMIGAGERAGSGVPKIYRGWELAQLRTPKLYEQYIPSEQTILELPTISLIPQNVISHLEQIFGNSYHHLNHEEQMIVTTAAIEGSITHTRACQLTSKHSRDVTLALQKLIKKGFLTANGQKKNKIYSLPTGYTITTEYLLHSSTANLRENTNNLTDNTNNLTDNTNNLTDNTNNLTDNVNSLTDNTNNLTDNANNLTDNTRDHLGRYLHSSVDMPIIDTLDTLTESFRNELLSSTEEVRKYKRLPPPKMRAIIYELCKGHYVRTAILEVLLNRKAQSLRETYLKPMVIEGLLKMTFPDKPNSPQQGYTSI